MMSKRKYKPYTCGVCGEVGHTKKRCPVARIQGEEQQMLRGEYKENAQSDEELMEEEEEEEGKEEEDEVGCEIM